MAAVSYGRPRLTTAEDKYYRAHVQQFVLQRKNQRAIRPPRQRDIFGSQAEQALRDWLTGQCTLSERRILEYEERRGKRAIMKYRELDAVVLEGKRDVWIFEVKASRSAGSLHRAVSQLQETRAIIRLLYPNVHATILLVDTGIPTAEDVAALMEESDHPETPPETLADAIAAEETLCRIDSLGERSTDGARIDLLVFGVDDIIAIAGAENLALDWSDEDAEEHEPLPSPSPDDDKPFYSTSEDDKDEHDDDAGGGGALAEALRRAGLGS
jgi:hypothetical protein